MMQNTNHDNAGRFKRIEYPVSPMHKAANTCSQHRLRRTSLRMPSQQIKRFGKSTRIAIRCVGTVLY